MAPRRYLPYREARDRSNIVVDGAALASTRLTLSHWPNNLTPPDLRRDTSTATAFAWLDAFDGQQDLPAFVTTNHFDEDGLFSMLAVTDPRTALKYRALLEDGAMAGDFGVVRSRGGARLCFAIEHHADPDASPLPPEVFAAADRDSALYEALLPRLPVLIDGLDEHPAWWRGQEEHLGWSNDRVRGGDVQIDDIPELDLAVVRIPPDLAERLVRRYITDWQEAIHPFAINTATPRSRILRLAGRHYSLEYRYESWVRLASRKVPLRVDLAPLAARLNDLDPAGPAWSTAPASDIVPRLERRDGSDSALSPEEFVAEVCSALRAGRVAWDPYDWQA